MAKIYVDAPSLLGIRYLDSRRPPGRPDEFCIQGTALGHYRIRVSLYCAKPYPSTEVDVDADGSWIARIDNNKNSSNPGDVHCSCGASGFIVKAAPVITIPSPYSHLFSGPDARGIVRIDSPITCVDLDVNRADLVPAIDPCKKIDFRCPELRGVISLKNSECNEFNVELSVEVIGNDRDFTGYWELEEGNVTAPISHDEGDSHDEGEGVHLVEGTYYTPGLKKARFIVLTPRFCREEYTSPLIAEIDIPVDPTCCPQVELSPPEVKDSDCNTFNVELKVDVIENDKDFDYRWAYGDGDELETQKHIEGESIDPVTHPYDGPGTYPARFVIVKEPEYCSQILASPRTVDVVLDACPECCSRGTLIAYLFLLAFGLGNFAAAPLAGAYAWIPYLVGAVAMTAATIIIVACLAKTGCNICATVKWVNLKMVTIFAVIMMIALRAGDYVCIGAMAVIGVVWGALAIDKCIDVD